MTEADWLGSTDPLTMLAYVREHEALDRKLRLFACAASRRVEHLLTDPRSQNALVVAERFADGDAKSSLLLQAYTDATAAFDDLSVTDIDVFDPALQATGAAR